MSNAEINFIMDAIESTALNFKEWMKDYTYNSQLNEYCLKGFAVEHAISIYDWFLIYEYR
jgi:hypothetical protein